MAEPALDCFTQLLESIPGWISDLEGIVASATERQKDILRENQPLESHDSQPAKPRRLSKSSSVRTRRSKDADDEEKPVQVQASAEEPVPTVVQKQVPYMTQSDALRLAQRKRKTASVCSDRQSGPLKYRSRSMVVIYYDGGIQKRFENIVRAIGSRRNALRKGRTSAQVYELSRNASCGSDGSSGEDSGAYVPKVAFRSARMRQYVSAGSGTEPEGLAAFDRLDGFLEKAQAQCERAAHQILRDGDCGLEVQTAKAQFISARTHCETELPIWRKRIEEAHERERQEEERRKAEEDEDQKQKEEQEQEQEQIQKTDFQDHSYTDKLLVDGSRSPPAPLEIDIEPDDSDGGEDDDGANYTMDMMQLRRSRPYMQTSRLAAAY